jgi:hypothetical protein
MKRGSLPKHPPGPTALQYLFYEAYLFSFFDHLRAIQYIQHWFKKAFKSTRQQAIPIPQHLWVKDTV